MVLEDFITLLYKLVLYYNIQSFIGLEIYWLLTNCFVIFLVMTNFYFQHCKDSYILDYYIYFSGGVSTETEPLIGQAFQTQTDLGNTIT